MTIGHIFYIAGESQAGNDFDVQIETDDMLKFYTESGGHTTDPVALTAADLNQWHFVAATLTAGVTWNIYLDGNLVGSSVPGGRSPNSSAFNMGQSDSFGRPFNGRLDEVALFDRELTATEVADIYNSAGVPTGMPLQLTAAVSRKTHGASGDFDLPLVLDPAGSGTVEPRASGPTTIVFAFNSDVAATDGTLDSNEFTITNATFSSASTSSNTLTLNLTGVIDQSVVSVTLSGIQDTSGNALSGDNDVEIRALVGDANQDQTVTKADLRTVRPHRGEVLDQMSGNYLFDLNLDGTIANGDLQLIRANKLHTVP